MELQVARCAKKLPNGPVNSIAAALGGPTELSAKVAKVNISAGDIDEDDLT